MYRFGSRKCMTTERKWHDIWLACWWIAGLFSGVFIYTQVHREVSSLMQSADFSSVSIPGLLLGMLFPLLLSFVILGYDLRYLIYGCAFGKACLFSFCACGFWDTFGSAGWLVLGLFLFHDSILCVVLYLFWLRHLPKRADVSLCSMLSYGCWCVLIGSLDYCYVMPFAGRIVS